MNDTVTIHATLTLVHVLIFLELLSVLDNCHNSLIEQIPRHIIVSHVLK